MKAVRIHEYGGPDVLKYEESPCPEPQAGEVLIRVRASRVNPVDWKIRQGQAKNLFMHSLPLIPGWDVSGVVAATGRGVRRLKEGDEVYSLLDVRQNGAYAEFTVMRESAVALKPALIDYIHAAAIPMAALTAWQSLFHAGGLRAGQKVLIHGAVGGVGSFAVQLAKWKGAYVIGTVSERYHHSLRELGADETIYYDTTRFETVVHDADMVLDTMGEDTLMRSWGVLKQGGILVSIAGQPLPEEAVRRGVRQASVFTVPMAEELAEIATLVDSGALTTVVDTVLPLAQARKAHVLSQAGHTLGKVVVLRVD